MDAAIDFQSRLIGAVLVHKGLITSEQLEQALLLQEETGERLGEIVVAGYGVSRLELASVLAEQRGGFEIARRHRESLEETLTARVEEISAAPLREADEDADEILARVEELEALRVADALALGARLAGIEAAIETPDDRERSRAPVPVGDGTGCVAFVPTAAGYELIELAGPAPAIGSSLELADGTFVVIGRGRSPLPEDGRPCAYLTLAV